MTDLDVRRSAPARQGPRGARAARPNAADLGSGTPDVAVNGLLDIDDGAWLRADGYLPGPDDIALHHGPGAGARAAPR